MTIKQIFSYEFDKLVSEDSRIHEADDLRVVPRRAFDWLDSCARRGTDLGQSTWVRPSRRRGCTAVELTNYVGVVRTPDGTQIEILPKVGKSKVGGEADARALLLDMLASLGEFRHIKNNNANLLSRKMALLEVFIGEFLLATQQIVKCGLRGDYSTRKGNVVALRGKLQIAMHLRNNLCRRDRFFSEFDEFSSDRPENRLVHSALRYVLSLTSWPSHQQLARELCFVFSEVPLSGLPAADFQRVRLDRGMRYYKNALDWARLILAGTSPLTGSGPNDTPSLLFPMESIFEAFVAKHIQRQLVQPFSLRTQVRSLSLVKHKKQDWFQLKPDLLVHGPGKSSIVLDTKWKLLDSSQADGARKYSLSQSDFYQMHAYGQNYLEGQGDVVLIYPKTDRFDCPLDVFTFPKSKGLRLWVLPFCLKNRVLLLPNCGSLSETFMDFRESKSMLGK
jgi:5-methylcytosine-specific restriction enzyme subunit McrC